MLLAVLFGLILWAAAAIYGFGIAIEHFVEAHRLKRDPLLVHIAPTMTKRDKDKRAKSRKLQARRAKSAGIRYGLLGLVLFVLGLIAIAAVLSAIQVTALIFGTVSFCTAFWLYRKAKRQRGRLATYLAGAFVLVVAGILILVFGL